MQAMTWHRPRDNATAGVDHGSQRATAEILPQIAPLRRSFAAALGITNGTTDVYSFDARATATATAAFCQL